MMKILTRLLGLITLVNVHPSFAVQDQAPLNPDKSHKHDLDIPALGLGLWNSRDDDATSAVKYAFKSKYTHFDSAAAYSNEKYVGAGLNSKSSLPRHRYWITSKLWNDHHRPELVPEALNTTLKELNTSYVDLYLMHWPVAFLPNQKNGRTVLDQDTSITDTWKAMEKLVAAYNETGHGARYIGISNFSPRQIDRILSMCTVCPYAHEYETHPYLQQTEFLKYHAQKGIRVIAYSPLANLNPTYKDKYPDVPLILEDPFWKGIAKEKNVTVAQAVLAWGIQRGTVVIPKSVHEDRILENFKALKLAKKGLFSKEDLSRIADEDKRMRFNNPSKSWGVEDLFEGLDDGSNRFFDVSAGNRDS